MKRLFPCLGLVAVLLLLLLALACTRASAPPARLPDASVPSARPGPMPSGREAFGLDVCALLQKEEATLVAGQPMQDPEATVEGDAPGCIYRSVDITESFSLIRLTVHESGKEGFETSVRVSGSPVPGVGDRAYIAKGEREIDVLVGEHWARMTVQGRIESTASLVEAARLVAQRLRRQVSLPDPRGRGTEPG